MICYHEQIDHGGDDGRWRLQTLRYWWQQLGS